MEHDIQILYSSLPLIEIRCSLCYTSARAYENLLGSLDILIIGVNIRKFDSTALLISSLIIDKLKKCINEFSCISAHEKMARISNET